MANDVPRGEGRGSEIDWKQSRSYSSREAEAEAGVRESQSRE
jgi:hypothetical protein